MKTIIGVMGPGSKEALKDDLTCAYDVGKIVAGTNCVLLCGGMTGVMEESAKGAKEAGGLVIGIGPTTDKREMNRFVDIPLLTGMNAGRNFMNVLSSDVLVFVSVRSPGTLSELAFAIQLNRPTIIIRGSDALKELIKEYKSDSVHFVDSLPELTKALEVYSDKNK